MMDYIEDQSIPFDENDIFQCGICKLEFNSFSTFKAHKYAKCRNKDDLCVVAAFSKECSDELANLYAPSITSKKIDENSKILDDESARVSVSSDDTLSPLMKKAIYPNNAVQVISVNGVIHLSAPMDENEIVASVSNLFSKAHNSTQTENHNGDRIIISMKSDMLSLPSPILPSTLAANGNEDASKIEQNNLNHEFFHGSLAKSITKIDQSKSKIKQKCCYCGREFVKNFDLQQHIRSHTGEKPYQCIVCGRAFAQKSNVKKHIETHKVWPSESLTHTLPKEPIKKVAFGNKREDIIFDDSYVCYFCEMSLNSYIELKSHMKIHVDQKVYACVQINCQQTFEDMDTFMDHVQNHGKDAQFRCHTCSKSFDSLQALGNHHGEHSYNPNSRKKAGESYLRCTKCLNKYSSAEALEYHLRNTSHHFPCLHCSKIFSSERLLRRHLNIHGNIHEMNACSTCKKEYKDVYTLKLHLLTHTGERPFKCQLCNAAFNRKDRLKRHMLIHSKKKLKCPFRVRLGCKLEFRRNDKLRSHMLSHVKPHKKLSSLNNKIHSGNKSRRKNYISLSVDSADEEDAQKHGELVAPKNVDEVDQIMGNPGPSEEAKKESELVLFEESALYEQQIQLIDDQKLPNEALSEFSYESGKKYHLVEIPFDHSWEARSLEGSSVVIHDDTLAQASAIFSENGEPFVASEIADLSLFVAPHVDESASIELTSKDVPWSETP